MMFKMVEYIHRKARPSLASVSWMSRHVKRDAMTHVCIVLFSLTSFRKESSSSLDLQYHYLLFGFSWWHHQCEHGPRYDYHLVLAEPQQDRIDPGPLEPLLEWREGLPNCQRHKYCYCRADTFLRISTDYIWYFPQAILTILGAVARCTGYRFSF